MSLAGGECAWGRHEAWHVGSAHARVPAVHPRGQLRSPASPYELWLRRGLFGNSGQVQKDKEEEELRPQLPCLWRMFDLWRERSVLSFTLNSMFPE